MRTAEKRLRKPRRVKAPPAAEVSVYDGSKLLGTIEARGKGFVAKNADGKPIGRRFANDRLAMDAICDQGRRTA